MRKIFCQFVIIILVIILSSPVMAQDDNPQISTLAFKTGGQLIARGHDNGLVQIVDIETGTVRLEYQAHSDRVTRIAWSPDGARIASSSWDSTVNVLNLLREEQLYRYSNNWWEVVVVAWSPDGNLLITGAAESAGPEVDVVQVLNANTGEEIAGISAGTPSDVGWSPDEKHIAIGRINGDAVIIYAATFEVAFILEGGDDFFALGNQLTDIDWSLDGRFLVAGTLGGTVRVWDMETRRKLYDLRGNMQSQPDIDSDYQYISTVFFSSDGTSFSSLSGDGVYRTWDSETGTLINETNLETTILASAINADKTQIAYVSIEEPGEHTLLAIGE